MVRNVHINEAMAKASSSSGSLPLKTWLPHLSGCGGQFDCNQLLTGATTMRKNELSWVMGYLAALTGVFWVAHMVGAHVHLVHAV
jgi:hypothetical protein